MAARTMYADTPNGMCGVDARALWLFASPFATKRSATPATVQVTLHGNRIERPLALGGISTG
ncbi:MAG: hypothetical protein JWO37_3001 [Acidimicrobiales bacterium]|jgi:hypothetical protein|nr:hypothetical protein [Acidimicrobiales bacterium]